MSVTENVMRLLASGRDPAAMLALKRQAMRTMDQTLMDFVNETARTRLRELNQEKAVWEECLENYLEMDTGPALILTSVGPKKIQVIKETRALTGLGLKEAKKAVDNCPSVLVEHIADVEFAQRAVLQLREVGAGAVWTSPEQFKGNVILHRTEVRHLSPGDRTSSLKVS